MIEQLFPAQVKTPEWQQKIRDIVPTYGQKLNGNVQLTQQVWDNTAQALQLTKPPVIVMPGAETTATETAPARQPSPQQDMAL